MNDVTDSRRRPSQPLRALLAVLALLAVAFALPLDAATRVPADQDPPQDPPAQGASGNPVQATRSALEKWVETRRLISREARDWALGKEILRDRIGLLDAEKEKLSGLIADAEKSIGEARATEQKLERQKAGLVESSKTLAETIAQLETRAKALAAKMPDAALADRIELVRRLPDDPNDTELSLGQRYQNVVGILDHLDKFHGEIHLVPETRTLGDGTTALVRTVYVGVGAGYFVTQDGLHAGIAQVTDQGWVWRQEDVHAPVIAKMVAMLEGAEPAGFISLPLEIR